VRRKSWVRRRNVDGIFDLATAVVFAQAGAMLFFSFFAGLSRHRFGFGHLEVRTRLGTTWYVVRVGGGYLSSPPS
jgi:hypothetical protein